MAHKGQGSTRNGRDSNPQYRGVKRFGGEHVPSGSIIVRQQEPSGIPEPTSEWDATTHFSPRRKAS